MGISRIWQSLAWQKRTGNPQPGQKFFLIERWESSRHSLTILDTEPCYINLYRARPTQVASEVNTKNSTNPRCGPQLGHISPPSETNFVATSCNQLQLAATTRIGRIGHLLTWIAPCQHWLCCEFTGSHGFTVNADTGQCRKARALESKDANSWPLAVAMVCFAPRARRFPMEVAGKVISLYPEGVSSPVFLSIPLPQPCLG